ncbi:arabinose 5-phosphate isomerase KdsD [bacterium BMS3Abin05]|nr:arabinose 5-phosphate isomerase KdsD [bacterium BMS3Abin05]GBE26706.1 arabinose 5-phosphate isomerase KdsD [bacterium BMS3Bbin03]HDZ12091.1 KpsF/GutQ family sugar-phosphate isomerase [Bacteroidota bacterium]
MNHDEIIQKGREVIRIEARGLENLVDQVDESFEKAVNLIRRSKGRVIVTGIGKSGIVGRKIAATLTSTGTAAFFLHPTEGAHGDLGMVLKEDVVICISKSGNTEELAQLFPILKRLGVPIITMTANSESELAQKSDVTVSINVKTEACPFDLAPTASTTATMAMGDALAVALLELRNFSLEDFARLHPGGSIGLRLRLRIDDVMATGNRVPKVLPEIPLKDAIMEMTSKRFGATSVIDGEDKLLGIITDGDVRRLIERQKDLWDLRAEEIMTPAPITVKVGAMAADAFNLMKIQAINTLLVVDAEKHVVGIVHIHDLLKAGIS